MPDHRDKVRYYRNRSEECRRIAELSTGQVAEHYRHIAECYVQLAEAEERFVNGARPFSKPGAAEPHP